MARTHLLFLAAGLAALPGAGRAQAAGDARLREALRSATAQVRALEDERASWQAREAALKKELESLRAQPRAEPAPRGSRREVAQLRAELAEKVVTAERASAGAAQCEAARQELTRASEEERAKASAAATELSGRLATAEAKNERLYRAGREILDWIGGQGVAAAVWSREPFLGLKRVELENAAQDRADRLLEHRLRPPGS